MDRDARGCAVYRVAGRWKQPKCPVVDRGINKTVVQPRHTVRLSRQRDRNPDAGFPAGRPQNMEVKEARPKVTCHVIPFVAVSRELVRGGSWWAGKEERSEFAVPSGVMDVFRNETGPGGPLL